MLDDLVIGAIVLGVAFGGALFGMFLKRVLPEQHLNTDARDVIRIVMAMLATLAAVVLGLLTNSAISSFAEREVKYVLQRCSSFCLIGPWPRMDRRARTLGKCSSK